MADHGAIGVNLSLLPNPPAGAAQQFDIDAVIAGTGHEFDVSAVIHVPALQSFTIGAAVRITSSSIFSIDAQLEPELLQITTHPRTGPHYATTPATHILTSQILGTMGSGSTLQAVLSDLDATLTDLERRQHGKRGVMAIDAIITE